MSEDSDSIDVLNESEWSDERFCSPYNSQTSEQFMLVGPAIGEVSYLTDGANSPTKDASDDDYSLGSLSTTSSLQSSSASAIDLVVGVSERLSIVPPITKLVKKIAQPCATAANAVGVQLNEILDEAPSRNQKSSHHRMMQEELKQNKYAATVMSTDGMWNQEDKEEVLQKLRTHQVELVNVHEAKKKLELQVETTKIIKEENQSGEPWDETLTKSERRSSQKEKLQSEYERLQEEISAERDNHNLVLKAKDTEMFKLKLQRDALQIKLDSLETSKSGKISAATMTNHEQGSSPTDKLRSELQRLQEVLVLEQNNHQKEMELKDKMLSEIRQKKIQLILDSPETNQCGEPLAETSTKHERRSSRNDTLESEYEQLQDEICAERDNHNLVLKGKDNQIFELKLQRDALQIKLDSLEKEQETLSKKLHSRNHVHEKNKELTSANQSLRLLITSLHKQLEWLEAEKNELTEEKRNLFDTFSELSKKLESAQSECFRHKEECNALEKNLHKLEERNAKVESEIEIYKSESRKLDQEMKKSKSNEKYFKANSERLMKEKLEIECKFESMEAQNLSLTGEKAALNAKLESYTLEMSEKLKAAHVESSEHVNKIETLNAELKSLEQANSAIESELKEIRTKCHTQEEELNNLRGELTVLQNNDRANKTEIESLTTRNSDIECQLEESRKLVDEVKQKEDTLIKANAMLRGKLSTAENNGKKSVEEITKLKSENLTLGRHLRSARRELDDYKKEASNLRAVNEEDKQWILELEEWHRISRSQLRLQSDKEYVEVFQKERSSHFRKQMIQGIDIVKLPDEKASQQKKELPVKVNFNPASSGEKWPSFEEMFNPYQLPQRDTDGKQ